jgi:hypothetical protein
MGVYPDPMSPIIDGRRWTRDRIRFLQALLLDPELPAERRTAIEAELAQLQQQSGRHGWMFGWWRRSHRPVDL